MGIDQIAVVGYALQAAGYSIAAVIFARQSVQSPSWRYIIVALCATAVHGSVLAVQGLGYIQFAIATTLVEWTRYMSWMAILVVVLTAADTGRVMPVTWRMKLLPMLAITLLVLIFYSSLKLDSLSQSITASGSIVLAQTLLILNEQLLRNFSQDSGPSLRVLGIALVFIAVYDLMYFALQISGELFVYDIEAARGFVNLVAAVPIYIAGQRASIESVDDDRNGIEYFGTSSIILVGILGIWLVADMYVNGFGGSWLNVGLVVILAAAILAIGILLVSRTAQRRVRVFLTKTFFRYKYDYRKEWLRFIGILSETGLEHVPKTAVRAVAPIVNSPGGIVWAQESPRDDYLPIGAWNHELPVGQSISEQSSLIRFLRERQWVIDLNEFKSHPKRYEGLELDRWLVERNDVWLVVPLLVGKNLLGLIVLLKPKVMPELNFEDHDLLRTVGRHVGTHIKQAESDRRLAESGQFGTYHRLSAFLMHDLNNLIAQQSLVVKNAEKHRHDPRFVDDTIDTIANSVARMRHLMEQLSRDSKTPATTRVRVGDVLQKAISRTKPRKPVPSLRIDDDGNQYLRADPERLTVIIEHLIRNSQDATDNDGSIEVVAAQENESAVISIRDTGCGMTPDFINERLFKPFDSTKGSESMGIGAYQAREYVRMLGGHIEVRSQAGKGATFTIRLPLAAGSAKV
jgi:putative PEP-CTERM system histidine kinase